MPDADFSLKAFIFDPDRIGLNLDLRYLSPDELALFIEPAEEVGGRFVEDRPSLASVFALIAALGRSQRDETAKGEGTVAAVIGTTPADPTTPLPCQGSALTS